MSDDGFVCSTCGNSDFGVRRFLSLGFEPHPCTNCADHFRPLLPERPETPPDAPESSSTSGQGELTPRLVPETTDTPDTGEPGTLW